MVAYDPRSYVDDVLVGLALLGPVPSAERTKQTAPVERLERHPGEGLAISSRGGELVSASRRDGIAIGPVSWRAAKKSVIQPPR